VSGSQSFALDNGTGRLTRRAWAALLVLCGAFFLDTLDLSMTTVALPSIGSDLDVSTSTLQWVVSGYVLGYGGFLLLGGRAADLLGRRRMFVISLGVFVVASTLGGLANDGTLLALTRFVKGVSAAFTAPAGLSIITTSFGEGPVRNKALAIYTATGATGFSLGLVFSGVLTELSWRLVFLLPAPLALLALVAALRLVPNDGVPTRDGRRFDLAGAAGVTAGMVLLVFTLVEAPEAGWASAQTLAGFAAAATILTAFVFHELRTSAPLVRLGILCSGPLVRANLGAMALLGSSTGFTFAFTLYAQQARGWSAIETGLAIFPAGLMTFLLAPRVAPLVERFGLTRLIGVGLGLEAAGYALFLPIGLDSAYLTAMLVPFVMIGLGFAVYGPLNIAATNGVAPEEQGLASGLVNTSFQFGGALVLAVATAVHDASGGSDGTPEGLLDGFHAATLVSVIVLVLGVAAVTVRRGARAMPAGEPSVTEGPSQPTPALASPRCW
jgi:MFS family permease